MYLLLVGRSIWRRKGYTLLTFASIAVGAALAATLFGFRVASRQHLRRELAGFGPNLRLEADPLAEGRLKAADLVRLRREAGPALDGAAPFVAAVGRLEGEPVAVVGSDLGAALALHRGWQLEGALPQSGEMLLGTELARRQRWRPGMRLALAGANGSSPYRFRVAGTLMSGGSEDAQVFVPLESFAEVFTGQARDEYDMVLARLRLDSKELDRFAARLTLALPGRRASAIVRVRDAEEALVVKVTLLLVVVCAVALALSTLCVMATASAVVTEREREIALMSALGLRPRTISSLLLGELLAVGLAGAVAGNYAGAVLARLVESQLFGATTSAGATVLPQVLAVGAMVVLVAGWLPLARARRIEPAVVLRGE